MAETISRKAFVELMPGGGLVRLFDEMLSHRPVSAKTKALIAKDMALVVAFICGNDALTGGQQSDWATAYPDKSGQPNTGGEVLKLFSLLQPETTIGLPDLVSKPTQLDTVWLVLDANRESVLGGLAPAQAAAIQEGRAIMVAGCGDSREVFLRQFSFEIPGEELVINGVVLETSAIGTQPAVAPVGVNESMFVPHVTACTTGSGCGALAGIEAIRQGETGIQALLNHGVSPGTMTELNRLKKMLDTGEAITAADWAKVGAMMQADMNFAAHSVNHAVAYGIHGTADGSFQPTQLESPAVRPLGEGVAPKSSLVD